MTTILRLFLTGLLLSACLPSAASAAKPSVCKKVQKERPVGLAMNGSLSGTPAAVIIDYTGGTGQAFDVIVYWEGRGVQNQTIRAFGGGDKMQAMFLDGKLITYNPVYLAGDSGCCGSKYIIQRYRLVDDGSYSPSHLHRELLTSVMDPHPSFDEDGVECPVGTSDSRPAAAHEALRASIIKAGRKRSNLP